MLVRTQSDDRYQRPVSHEQQGAVLVGVRPRNRFQPVRLSRHAGDAVAAVQRWLRGKVPLEGRCMTNMCVLSRRGSVSKVTCGLTDGQYVSAVSRIVCKSLLRVALLVDSNALPAHA